MPSMILSLLKFIAITYFCLLVLSLFFTNFLMFPRFNAFYEQKPPYFKISVRPGMQVSVIYYKPKKPIATLLLSHGNGEDIGRINWFLKELYQHNIAVLAYDYPGYGHSDGQPSEQSTYLAIEAAYHWLTTDGKIPPEKLFIYGYSIGSGPSTELAMRHPNIAGLIIASGFTSAYRVLTHWPILPFDKYQNLKKIAQLKMPSLFIHGRKDRIVPFWHGQALYKRSASKDKSALWINQANHLNYVQVGGQLYWQTLVNFLNQHAQPTNKPIPMAKEKKSNKNNQPIE